MNIRELISNKELILSNNNLVLSNKDFIEFKPSFNSINEYLSMIGEVDYYNHSSFKDYFESSCNNCDQTTFIFTKKYGLGFDFNEGRPYIYINDVDQQSETFGDGLLLIFLPFDNYNDLKFNLNKIELLALDILYIFMNIRIV